MWERETFFVARGELGIAAGVKRRGFDIELEPATGNGKRCDFRAMTDPPTWWEIKALGKIERVADDDRIVREVQSGLRRIPEPYALAIEESNVALGDVQRAVKKIKNEIASHFRDRKKPPATFSAFGLNVKVMARSNLGYGYVGITNFQGYVFGDEHSARAADRIVDALAQLPKGECGLSSSTRHVQDGLTNMRFWTPALALYSVCTMRMAAAMSTTQAVQLFSLTTGRE